MIGHRPDRLRSADLGRLERVIGGILDAIRDESAQGSAPSPGAISPLAEGVDRIFAQAAVERGYELRCVLPFARAEYERDFAPGTALEERSLESFRRLVDGRPCLELDGDRRDEAGAYGRCGQWIVDASDLLIAVWDGEREGKAGGTEQTLEEAVLRGVPVAWIDAHDPHDWQLLVATRRLPRRPGGRAEPQGHEASGELRDLVRALLASPER
ncbi:MAG: hypothetical protein EXS08_06700 [Planctomycetes bacterium]|nr:hypothetical protein [Planctomycetota bacterium]